MSGQLACYGIGARSARLRKFALPTPRYGQPAKICTGNLTGSELQKNMHSAKILLSPYTSAAHTETARQSSSMRDCAHSYGHRSRHSGRTWFATYTLGSWVEQDTISVVSVNITPCNCNRSYYGVYTPRQCSVGRLRRSSGPEHLRTPYPPTPPLGTPYPLGGRGQTPAIYGVHSPVWFARPLLLPFVGAQSSEHRLSFL